MTATASRQALTPAARRRVDLRKICTDPTRQQYHEVDWMRRELLSALDSLKAMQHFIDAQADHLRRNANQIEQLEEVVGDE